MNKNTIYLIMIVFLFSVFCIFSPLSANVGEKVEIGVDAANIRSLAGLNGDIIGKAYKGEVFKVLGIEENWYKISFVNKKGKKSEGYVHKEIVKVVSSETKVTPPPPPPPSEKEVKQSVKKAKQKKVVKKKSTIKFEQEKLFSGFYLKGGTMTSPKMDSFGDKWIAVLGFDKVIGKYMAWGLEFQPYYRNFSEASFDLSFHNLSMNIFVNFKGGINFGKFFEPLKFFTLYGGVGVGTSLSFSYIDFEGVSSTDFAAHFAWHYMIGSEISLGKMNLILEVQGVRVIDPDIDPSTISLGYFMIGIRF